ncbi:MAG: hypothetical protein OEV68_17235, partial [candidate division Zixibacteria bacterium]|nr:hypothetical protein [candidate division Zixibacteria bacterium]
MFKTVITLTLLMAPLHSHTIAQDLYKVTIDSRSAADRLESCQADVVLRVENGYLVLVDSKGIERLTQSGLRCEEIATDVDRGEIALDTRLDLANRGRYPMLFEEGQVRLYRADPLVPSRLGKTTGLAGLPTGGLRIVYRESQPLNMGRLSQVMDLNALIGLVEQDSLESYSAQLETFWW